MMTPEQTPVVLVTPPASISPREREVLTLLATGLTKAEVGARLGISEHTVRHQTATLRERLGTSSVMETLFVLGWMAPR